MCRYENPNGGVRWDIAEDKKWTTSGYDDRAYTFAMAGYYLWELRHKDTAERNKNEMDLSSIPRCVSSITF